MSSVAQAKLIKSQLELLCGDPVDISSREDVDRELIPILSELFMIKPWDDNHPTVKKIFNWLMEHHRTVEDFIYVFWHLRERVYSDLLDDDIDVEEELDSLFKVALEVLAAKCAALTGKWELAAWVTLNMIEHITWYDSDKYGHVSKHTGTWIINMIGNSELCPNENLRIELITLIKSIYLNEHNIAQAFESIISACTNLDMGFVTESHYGKFSNFCLLDLILILEKINEVGYLTRFDWELEEKMSIEPKVLRGLTALINAIADYARIENQYIYEDSLPVKYIRMPGLSYNLINIMKRFISIFKRSCIMPQLISNVASCTKVVLNYSMWLNLALASRNLRIDNICLGHLEELLNELGGGSKEWLTSPIGREMTKKHGGELEGIQSLMKHMAEIVSNYDGRVFGQFSMILELRYAEFDNDTDSDDEGCNDDECGCICFHE